MVSLAAIDAKDTLFETPVSKRVAMFNMPDYRISSMR